MQVSLAKNLWHKRAVQTKPRSCQNGSPWKTCAKCALFKHKFFENMDLFYIKLLVQGEKNSPVSVLFCCRNWKFLAYKTLPFVKELSILRDLVRKAGTRVFNKIKQMAQKKTDILTKLTNVAFSSNFFRKKVEKTSYHNKFSVWWKTVPNKPPLSW